MIDDGGLAGLHTAVEDALHRGDASGLEVLGYGEISLVLGWPSGSPRLACKRLPVFPDADAYRRYAATLTAYLDALGARGVRVAETTLHSVPLPRGRVAAYAVQPALPADTVGPEWLRPLTPDAARPVARVLVETVAGVLDGTVGLDGQLTNWAFPDPGPPVYLDVTTPMLRDHTGRVTLDTGLFTAALPWPLREPVRRFVVPGIVARYHRPRDVLLDLAANLHKERLARLVPVFVAEANRVLDVPLTEAEVGRYYRGDARLWRALLALRRADREWQRRVRRRPYPFLLPGRIDR